MSYSFSISGHKPGLHNDEIRALSPAGLTNELERLSCRLVTLAT
jgi:hypothetical protein